MKLASAQAGVVVRNTRNGLKWCPDCQADRSASDFYTDGSGKYLDSVCKTHRSARVVAKRGTDFYPHLAIDHVDGDGAAERRATGGGNMRLYRRLRREGFPPGYQVLCFNCNQAKHVLGRCTCSDRKAVAA